MFIILYFTFTYLCCVQKNSYFQEKEILYVSYQLWPSVYEYNYDVLLCQFL